MEDYNLPGLTQNQNKWIEGLVEKVRTLNQENYELRLERERDLKLLRNKELKIVELKNTVESQSLMIFRIQKGKKYSVINKSLSTLQQPLQEQKPKFKPIQTSTQNSFSTFTLNKSYQEESMKLKTLTKKFNLLHRNKSVSRCTNGTEKKKSISLLR